MYASNPGPQWEKSICIPQLSNRVGRRFVISARVACIDFSHSSCLRPISQARSTHQSRSWRVPALMPAQSDQVTSCGCSVNARTTEELVELDELRGEEFLFVRARRLDVALLRGTTADAEGNITMER